MQKLSIKSWIWGVIGAIFTVCLALYTHWWQPIQRLDLNQQRLNVALPIPQGTNSHQQTFTPTHNHLSEIEVIVVKYEDNPAGTFTLTLLDPQNRPLASQTWQNAHLAHNQLLTLRFSPLSNTQGQTYTLVITGNEQNQVTVWGYTLNVIANGELSLASPIDPQPTDIRLLTRYTLTPSEMLSQLASIFIQQGGYLLLAMAFLLLPGLLWLHWLPLLTTDKVAQWGLALTLGITAWGILWLWLTTLGGHWQGVSLWAVFTIGYIIVLYRAVQQWRTTLHTIFTILSHPLFWLLLIALSLRILAVSNLAFPPWVDSTRHALITAVMAEQGQFLSTYAPFLPVNEAPYHFGFHTLSASLTLMTHWALPELLLYFGQLLNALMLLMVYTGALLFTRRRAIGLFAAFLVGIPFFFPAYYATWGRFTQLTAMLVMPALLALTWQLIRGAKAHSQQAIGWVAILSAGLFLIHLRVFLLYLPFVFLVGLVSFGRNLKELILAGILGMGLALPRLWQLWQLSQGRNVVGGPPNYNAFPTGYIEAGWEQYFLWAAGLALLIVLIATLWQQRWALLPLMLTGWVLLLGTLLSGRLPFIPATWLINLNSAYITIFLPLSLLLAIVTWQLWQWLQHKQVLISILSAGILGATITLLSLFGIRQQITILNEITILAQTPDYAGIQWVKENIPTDAVIAVNSWQWLGDTWTGSDGGAWLVPLTQRQTTTPPADYTYDKDLRTKVMNFNRTTSQIGNWEDAETVTWLQEQGVTHLFIGVRGGFFQPEVLIQHDNVEQLYGKDGVFVFALIPE